MKLSIGLTAALFVAVATPLIPQAHAQTRTGRAAYHLGSRGMSTCARYEKVGTVLKVTNPETGKTIHIKVTGRGPYNGNRILDLSPGSFKALYGGLGRGHGPVRYTVVKKAS